MHFFCIAPMRSFGGISGRLPPPWRLPAPDRLALDGDRVVAQGQKPEQEGAARPAEDGAQGHEGEEHQHAAIAFKVSGLKDFHPGKA